VGDFGISKMLEKNDGLASTTIGTPYYLAPEVSKYMYVYIYTYIYIYIYISYVYTSG